MSAKSRNFIVLKIKPLRYLLMDEVTTLSPEIQALKAENLFSIGKSSCSKKIKVDFNAPDLSSNGSLILLQGMDSSFLYRLDDTILDWRNPNFILHPMREMIRQRVGQIACGYEDAMTATLSAMTAR